MPPMPMPPTPSQLRESAGELSRQEGRRFAELLVAAVNAHDAATIVDFYADDAVMESPQFHHVTGRAAIAQTWAAVFATYPDWRVDVTDVLVDGNRLAMLGTAQASDRQG